jgi:hypothetical protein
MSQTANPIQSVDGVEIPCPTKYDWKLSDVSAADAGRTEDAKMHKMRIAQKVHLELEWQHMSDAAAQEILLAFQPEYINVSYYDYKALAYQTKRFYVGDRNVSSYNRAKGISTISFNIIEQ